jgi:DNA-directed RNA polymerase subunit RPC12/RpoP/ribosomal protein L24E
MIYFRCHGCGQKLRAEYQKAGSTAVCKKCRRRVLVPALESSPEKPSAETSPPNEAILDPFADRSQAIPRPIRTEKPPPKPTDPRPTDAVLIVRPKNAFRPELRSPFRWQSARPRKRTIYYVAGAFFLGILAIASWFLISTKHAGPVPPQEEAIAEDAAPHIPSLDEARAEAAKFVEARCLDQLKAPKTAEFSPSPALKITNHGGGRFLVSMESWVDAQNPFGVPLRHKISALVRFVPTVGWSFYFLFLDGDLVESSETFDSVLKHTQSQLEPRSWKGSGKKETEEFEAGRTPWRVRWTSTGGLVATLRDVNGGLAERVISQMEAGSGETLVRKNGKFYFEIESFTGYWKVSIDQGD